MRRGTAAWYGAACLLVSAPGLALEISLEASSPAPVGQPASFRVASVADAKGDVTYRWNFGDGTIVGPGAGSEVPHTYASAGHYTVIVLGTDAESNRTSGSFTHTAHAPLTDTPPSNASSVLFDVVRNQIWNVNPDNDSVSVSDAGSLQRLQEIPAGDEPRSLAQAPDGAIWITNQRSDELVVLEPGAVGERARIALPYASQPYSVAFGANGKAYVSLYGTGELIEIDAASRKLGRRLALGPTPAGIAVAADGRIFVTRFVSPETHGEVWLVSPESFEVVRTIQLARDLGPDSESAGRGVPNYLSSVVISPDGAQAWVTAKKDNVERGPQRDGLSLNSDNFVRAIVCVLDLTSESEVLAKRMDVDNRALPVSVAFSPVGDYAYMLLQGSNWVGIFDAYKAQNVGGIKDIGKAPDGLAFSTDGRLFVNAYLSRELFVYDLRESLASRDQQAPPALATIRTVDSETLSEQVLFGKQVFNDASDKRMSEIGYMSCASCHYAGASDGRVWDFTDRGEGLRNTKALVGLGGVVSQGRLHWSANFDEIQDFERDIRHDFGGTGFMSDADWLARADDMFGTPTAGVSPELDALATYLTSLDESPRSPFRNPNGSFTADARKGREVFLRAGCAECHADPTFTNSNSGELFDVGTQLPSSGQRLGAELTGIDTPSLKGLWQSAPYLHDGRSSTLMEIFTTYILDDKMGRTSPLSELELQQMVRYLQELDDVPETEPTEKAASPSSGGGVSCAVASIADRSPAGGLLAALVTLLGLAVRARRRRPQPALSRG